MTLWAFIVHMLSGGGIGWVCSKLFEWADTRWPQLQELYPEERRWVVFGGTAVFSALLGWFLLSLAGWMGYQATPATPQAWVEQLFAIAVTAITAGQVRHGREMRRRREAEA